LRRWDTVHSTHFSKHNNNNNNRRRKVNLMNSSKALMLSIALGAIGCGSAPPSELSQDELDARRDDHIQLVKKEAGKYKGRRALTSNYGRGPSRGGR
jgi:hypothetical protein